MRRLTHPSPSPLPRRPPASGAGLLGYLPEGANRHTNCSRDLDECADGQILVAVLDALVIADGHFHAFSDLGLCEAGLIAKLGDSAANLLDDFFRVLHWPSERTSCIGRKTLIYDYRARNATRLIRGQSGLGGISSH